MINKIKIKIRLEEKLKSLSEGLLEHPNKKLQAVLQVFDNNHVKKKKQRLCSKIISTLRCFIITGIRKLHF